MPLKVLPVVHISSRSELVCMAADKLFEQATDDYAITQPRVAAFELDD